VPSAKSPGVVVNIAAFQDRPRVTEAARKTTATPVIHKGRTLTRSLIPVLDHAGVRLELADPARVKLLMARADIRVLGTKTRIRALQFSVPVDLSKGSGPRRPLGNSHTSETYYNPAGIWHLDRIPEKLAPLFQGVLRSVSIDTPTPAPMPAEVIPFPVPLPKAA
jgi:hypothetical protein